MGKIIRLISVFCFLFLSVVYGSSNNVKPDKIKLIQLLENEDFDHLDKILSDYQKKCENNISKEGNVQDAFDAFENSDPSLEQHLEKWVSSKPNSASAHMALGTYHYNLGWLSRGFRWAKDTTSKQFAKMKAHFRKAHDEFKETVRLNPKMTIAYSYLIAISGGDKVSSKQILDEALSHNPLSKAVRLYYVQYLQPKWGGSLGDVEKFIADLKPLYSQNKHLKDIEGRLPYTQGDILFTTYDNDKVKLSIPYFNEAVQKSGQNRSTILRRAEAYRYLDEYQKALDDCNEVLRRDPQHLGALILRGKVFIDLKNYDKALKDLNMAIRLDKLNPAALRNKGIALYKLKHRDESFQPFIDSLTYGYSSSLSHTYLGYIYYYDKKNYTLAAQELKTAIELGNEDSQLWYFATASQWHDRDCDFVKSAYQYKEACTLQNDCDQKKLGWAIKSADFAVKRGVCTN
jgi:tetratricopeptide (TPR) repeat protein